MEWANFTIYFYFCFFSTRTIFFSIHFVFLFLFYYLQFCFRHLHMTHLNEKNCLAVSQSNRKRKLFDFFYRWVTYYSEYFLCFWLICFGDSYMLSQFFLCADNSLNLNCLTETKNLFCGNSKSNTHTEHFSKKEIGRKINNWRRNILT